MTPLLKRLSGWMAGLACVCLVFLMAVTFLDVVGRYFFGLPLTFAVELTELAMGLLISFGLAITTLNRGHIAVDLLTSIAPRWANAVFIRLAALAGVLVFGLMAWRLLDRALNFRSDGLVTQVLGWPIYPVVMLMAGAALAAAVIALVQLVGRKNDA